MFDDINSYLRWKYGMVFPSFIKNTSIHIINRNANTRSRIEFYLWWQWKIIIQGRQNHNRPSIERWIGIFVHHYRVALIADFKFSTKWVVMKIICSINIKTNVVFFVPIFYQPYRIVNTGCLLYTSDAADDTPCVDLGGRRIIKKKKKFFFFFFFFFFFLFFFYFFFFSSRRRHTRSSTVSWARRCV